MKVLHNSSKFRVLWHGRTELTDVSGGYKSAVPVPRVLWCYSSKVSSGAHQERSHLGVAGRSYVELKRWLVAT